MYDTPHEIVSMRTATRYLPGAAKSFKKFAARTGARLHRTAVRSGVAAECTPYIGMTVHRYHTRGFAEGGVSDNCSGAMAVWKRVGRHWKMIETSQEPYSCTSLNHYGVPDTLFEPGTECWNPSTQEYVVYHHG